MTGTPAAAKYPCLAKSPSQRAGVKFTFPHCRHPSLTFKPLGSSQGLMWGVGGGLHQRKERMKIQRKSGGNIPEGIAVNPEQLVGITRPFSIHQCVSSDESLLLSNTWLLPLQDGNKRISRSRFPCPDPKTVGRGDQLFCVWKDGCVSYRGAHERPLLKLPPGGTKWQNTICTTSEVQGDRAQTNNESSNFMCVLS